MTGAATGYYGSTRRDCKGLRKASNPTAQYLAFSPFPKPSAASEGLGAVESEFLDGVLFDMSHRFVERIGDHKQSQVGFADRPLSRHVSEEIDQRGVIVFAHQHYWEVEDLAGLDQRQRLEQFIHRADAARQSHKR